MLVFLTTYSTKTKLSNYVCKHYGVKKLLFFFLFFFLFLKPSLPPFSFKLFYPTKSKTEKGFFPVSKIVKAFLSLGGGGVFILKKGFLAFLMALSRSLIFRGCRVRWRWKIFFFGVCWFQTQLWLSQPWLWRAGGQPASPSVGELNRRWGKKWVSKDGNGVTCSKGTRQTESTCYDARVLHFVGIPFFREVEKVEVRKGLGRWSGCLLKIGRGEWERGPRDDLPPFIKAWLFDLQKSSGLVS